MVKKLKIQRFNWSSAIFFFFFGCCMAGRFFFLNNHTKCFDPCSDELSNFFSFIQFLSLSLIYNKAKYRRKKKLEKKTPLSEILFTSLLSSTVKEPYYKMFRQVTKSAPVIRTTQRLFARSYIAGQFTGSKGSDGKYTVTLIEGDGIGPEISQAVKDIYAAADVPIHWEPVDVTPLLIDGKTTLPQPAVDSVNKNLVALKGPLATPVGKGHTSMNLTLRRTFNLFANVRPCKSIVGYETPYENVDTVLIRENTEGEYSGIEHTIVPGVVQSIKLITKPASEKVIRYAFEYAKSINKPHVLVVHKASIMKLSDGLFVNTAKEVAQEYPDVSLDFELLDNTSLRLTADPSQYKNVVMVMPNLYGDIMSDLSSGLIGGLGLTPSGNMGNKVSIFEAVHGSAPDIAGKGLANPTALLLSSCMMLRHMSLNSDADRIENAVLKTIASGPENRTGDLKGTATTTRFTEEVIKNL